MKITRIQLRKIINEEVQKLDEIPTYIKNAARRRGIPHMGSGPMPRSAPQAQPRKDIVHGRVGEIYEEDFLESEFEVWLRKNPEYRRANPGETYAGWWGTDTLDDSQWYVDGPEEGPAWTLGSRDWSLDPKPGRPG